MKNSASFLVRKMRLYYYNDFREDINSTLPRQSMTHTRFFKQRLKVVSMLAIGFDDSLKVILNNDMGNTMKFH